MSDGDPDRPRAAEAAGERRSRLGLAAFMIGAGVTHFVRPGFYDPVVPSWMPGDDRSVVHVSGVAEMAVGALLVSRRTARWGGWATLAVLVGVYPANVQMALDAGVPDDAEGWVLWGRLPLQVPLWAWAWRVARRQPS